MKNKKQWTHSDVKGVVFDGDYKVNKKGVRVFKLEPIGKKKGRKTFASWQAAKKAGWKLG